MDMMRDASPQEQEEFKNTMEILPRKLIEEIKAQRDLAAAENNEMKVTTTTMDSLAFLHLQCEMYRSLAVEENLVIHIDPLAAQVTLTSDATLLGRVIGNMIKKV